MPDESDGGGAVSLRFSGQAGEYFRIWIVNVCLSVVTLGIYSAWAKVRRKKYFYGNTLLNGASFEYLADPKAILKGRLIVFGVFVLYQGLNHLAAVERISKGFPLFTLLVLVFIVVLWFALPELIIRTLSFNARNTAHRSVRFRFGARGVYGERRRFPYALFFFWPLTLGLLYPYYAFRKRTFILENTSYGTTPFAFDAEASEFYWAYAKSALMFLAFVAGSIVTLGIGILPLYILFASYRDAVVARLTWRHTTLRKLRFECNWKTWGLFKLNFMNSLGIIFTVGLLAPWAAVRSARYQLQGISVRPASELGGFVAAAVEQVAATAEEAIELIGFDFSI